MILGFKSSLRLLELSEVYLLKDEEPEDAQLFFPNLVTFCLSRVDGILLNYFSSLEAPKLQPLTIIGQNPRKPTREAFACLISLLKSHSFHMVEINFR